MGRQAIAAIILAVGLMLSSAGAAPAADSRTGNRTCATGYNAGASTTTTSSENHSHFYRSDSGATRTRTTPSAVGFGSSSFYRVVDHYNLSNQRLLQRRFDEVQQEPGAIASVPGRTVRQA